MTNVTRGFGLFEDFLAKKRTSRANNLLNNVSRSRILDIGCGSYPYFLLNVDFKEKYGVDPSLTTLNIKDLKLEKIDVTKKPLPFGDSYFDSVTMLAVFEHIDHNNLNFVLKEVRRVLKKDGIFIITTPAPWADKLLHFMARFGLISAEEIHEHKHNHSKEKIEDILIEAGFDKRKIKSGFFEIYMNMWFTASK